MGVISHVVDAVVVAAVLAVPRRPPPSTILRLAVTIAVSSAAVTVFAPVVRMVEISDPDRFFSVLLLLLFSLIILWYDHRSCSD